jgi:hypothetical protein
LESDFTRAAAEHQSVGPQHRSHQPFTACLLPSSATVYCIQLVCLSLNIPFGSALSEVLYAARVSSGPMELHLILHQDAQK